MEHALSVGDPDINENRKRTIRSVYPLVPKYENGPHIETEPHHLVDYDATCTWHIQCTEEYELLLTILGFSWEGRMQGYPPVYSFWPCSYANSSKNMHWGVHSQIK